MESTIFALASFAFLACIFLFLRLRKAYQQINRIYIRVDYLNERIETETFSAVDFEARERIEVLEEDYKSFSRAAILAQLGKIKDKAE